MASQFPSRTCYTCGYPHHFFRECPQGNGGSRPPATGANAVPTGPPLLTLPAPQSSATNAGVHVAGTGSHHYGGIPRANFWKSNQGKLDRVFGKLLADEEKEKRQKEEEERMKREKEEEERRAQWKKEREKFKEDMGVRLEQRMDKVMGRTKQGDSSEDEVTRLKKENEDLRRALLSGGESSHVEKLKKGLAELQTLVATKHTKEDEMAAIRQEIEQLRSSASARGDVERELADLKSELVVLRGQSERALNESQRWKDEAMRPGNKRGNIALSTPDATNRGTPRARWTDLGQDGADRWKAEYRKLQELRRADFAEVEMLKKKHAMAASEVLNLQKKMSELSAEDREAEKTGRGTNLKEKLEAVALRSARKGKKATPNRDGTKKTTDRSSFVEKQKKQLGQIRKSGLETLCKEAGLGTGKVDAMIDAIAEHRAMQAFGSFPTRNRETVVIDSESTQEVGISVDAHDASIEL
ncbi:hypothetical protein CBR_g29881 [Chara braunii]|uniref:CCHC-type domain-containing protein n=1 Tax=Chara braunii TaxID=69332 RepID=A0A388JWX0_CHABU|nr:hypothetical protein CBR_g29881 [Chara braunii]|eukprot:GBG62273.1 hypothetical protein CBR_g29881 [Chara braunii]